MTSIGPAVQDEDVEAEERRSVLAKLESHLGLVVSAGIGIAIVARILAVSGFQTTTALAVFSSQGGAAIVVGSLIPVVQSVPMVAMLVLLVIAELDGWTGQQFQRARWIVRAMLAISIVLSPWPLAIWLVVVMVLMEVRGWRRRRAVAQWSRDAHAAVDAGMEPPAPPKGVLPDAPTRFDRLVEGAGAGAMALPLGLLLFTILLQGTPWLPAERLTQSNGKVVVGYVLEQRDGASPELVVLQRSPRMVRVIPAEGIVRRICEPRSKDGRAFIRAVNWAASRPPVAGVVSDQGKYERCPDSD